MEREKRTADRVRTTRDITPPQLPELRDSTPPLVAASISESPAFCDTCPHLRVGCAPFPRVALGNLTCSHVRGFLEDGLDEGLVSGRAKTAQMHKREKFHCSQDQ